MGMEIVWKDYDVIVVGSGGAGSAAAHAASGAGARVLVVAKDPIGCSDSKIAEGIVTVRGVAEDTDSHEALSDNLRIAGGDLPLPEITQAFADDSEEAYDWLRRQGVRPRIEKNKAAPVALPIPLGGHTHRRSVGHDNGGLSVGHAAWNAVVQGNGIDYVEDSWFLEIVTASTSDEPSVVGGLIYDAGRGELLCVRAPAVIVAAGGLSTLYFPNTDTMRGNTGDSYALAVRAGAELIDMEQVQFLPFCLTAPPSYEGLLAGEPGTAGYLGVIRDADGKVILDSVMLRTRAECAAAIVKAVEAGKGTERGGCYLDLTANVKGERSGVYYKRFLETSLSGVMATVRQALGRAAAECKELWEVRPGAHYSMGGIRVDEFGSAVSLESRAVVRGLFAAGQAMGGVFGANRLGSTSLSEGPIFGSRAGRTAAALCTGKDRIESKVTQDAFAPYLHFYRNLPGQKGDKTGSGLIRKLQETAWTNIGPARTKGGIEKFLAQINKFRKDARKINISEESLWNQSFIDYVELANMLDTAHAIAVSALDREDSLGAHMRLDGGVTSILLDKPYSVATYLDDESTFEVDRLPRPSTPWQRLMAYVLRDRKRKLGMKLLRILPVSLQDRIIEERYRSVMGNIDPEPHSPSTEVQSDSIDREAA